MNLAFIQRELMIILEPAGGLCNRMRAIVGAMELAKKKRTKLIVLWKCKAELNAPFQTLFKPIKGVKIISYKSSKDIRAKFLRSISKNIFEDNDIKEALKSGNGQIGDKLFDKIGTSAYIWTCSQMYPQNEFFSLFKPIDRLERKIEKLEGIQNLIGVHIRRTDQIDSIRYSKTENFIELMSREIEKNPKTMFYLATDDMSEEEYIRKIFPDRIVSYENRALSRDSQTGISDAVIDLYCLSKCKKIVGSYWSSFTDVAAIIGNCEKIIAGLDN